MSNNLLTGLDSFHPVDFRLLPLKAFEWIAQIFTMVEAGCACPKDSLHIGAHLLPKDTTKPYDPLAYRILLITPALYRLWARCRLSHLQPWIEKWVPAQAYAGTLGVGAEDAWYLSSIELEHSILQGQKMVGGTLDLFKCFDQISRPLLYSLFALAGCPKHVMVAYINYHEVTTVRHIIGNSIGTAHSHRCGIPKDAH